jgi:hypothetical protein
MEKKCTKCGEVKTLDEFTKDKYKKDGKSYLCKSCKVVYSKKIYEKNKNEDISRLQFIKLFNENNGLRECSKCGEVKSLDMFYKKYKKSTAKCIFCIKKEVKEYRQNNKKKIKNAKKIYCDKNKEKIKLQNKKTYQKYSEKYKINAKEYHQNNKEIIAKKSKEYRIKNKETLKDYQIEYKRKNRYKYREQNNKYAKYYSKFKRENDPLYKLTVNIRSNISYKIKNQGYTKKTKTYNILQCEFSFFMQWLNGIASNGYTYGVGDLHLDHVVPVSLAQTEDEILLLCHYSNYQLLSADENLKKHNRYVNPVNLARVLEHHPNPDKIREIHARI